MRPAFSIENEDLEATARFFVVTLRHIESLRSCQRHEAAMDSLVALRRLARTIRETEGVHGYMADVLFGDLFREAELA